MEMDVSAHNISMFSIIVPYLFVLIGHNGASLIVLLSGESFWLLV